jgi:hypothetical protein
MIFKTLHRKLKGQAVLVPHVSGKGIVDMSKPNVLERNIH